MATQVADGAPRMINRIAAAPISWGVCEVPEWGAQLPPSRVLGEMAELGFTCTEAGAAGYLPDQPEALRARLSEYGLGLLGGFVPLVLHQPAEREATLAAAHAQADLFRAAGARYFVTAAVTSADWAPKTVLREDQWQHVYEMLTEVEAICDQYGLIQAVHPHLETVIERADEVQRVLDNTTVGWTLDTGHLQIGGYDPLEFARNYTDRIRHVHLKDVVMELAIPVLQGQQTIMAGVQAGMFCNLGAGDVDIAGAIEIMVDADFDGWYVIEQDAAIEGDIPPLGAGPVLDVAASVTYLSSLATSEAKVRTNNNEGNSS